MKLQLVLNNKVSLQLFEFWEETIWVSTACVVMVKKADPDKMSAQALRSEYCEAESILWTWTHNTRMVRCGAVLWNFCVTTRSTKKKINTRTQTQKTIYIRIQNDNICFPDLFYTLLCHMNSQTIICKCVVVLIECKEISLKFCNWISIVVSEKVPVDTKLRRFLSL